MESLLQDYVISQIVIFALTFCRVGTALMLMPGIGDSFINMRVRILFAVAMTVVLAPVTAQYFPDNVTNTQFIWLIITEVLIGFFIGTVARIFMAALDVAGMLIGLNIGLGSAMMFNPQFASQGSVIGAFLSITGAVLLFATDLHHMLIYGVMDSYKTFPTGGEIPGAAAGMAQTIVMAVNESFKIGFYMAIPFMTVSLFLYIAMGVLGRLMPQIQVFILALPLQIGLGLVAFSMVFSAIMFYWLMQYDEAIQMFFERVN
jgi:flagellar biosynthetic protein FliR